MPKDDPNDPKQTKFERNKDVFQKGAEPRQARPISTVGKGTVRGGDVQGLLAQFDTAKTGQAQSPSQSPATIETEALSGSPVPASGPKQNQFKPITVESVTPDSVTPRSQTPAAEEPQEQVHYRYKRR